MPQIFPQGELSEAFIFVLPKSPFSRYLDIDTH